jgi:ribA/ribD-fused uncharacterized protein
MAHTDGAPCKEGKQRVSPGYQPCCVIFDQRTLSCEADVRYEYWEGTNTGWKILCHDGSGIEMGFCPHCGKNLNLVTGIIDSFMRENRWASNFAMALVMYDGKQYPSTEHAYQAAKSTDPVVCEKIRLSPTPAEAKRIGGRILIRPDWEQVKYGIMEDLVRQKFTKYEKYKKLLLATGNATLIEGNYWHDNTWGRCKCGKRPECDGKAGKNWLGEILMKIRWEIRNEGE